MEYRREIDGLRAVAVLAVTAFHYGFPFSQGGFVGVDVFFVISGYLITLVILNGLEAGRFSFASFYEHRARRLLPAVMVTLVAVALVGYLVFTPLHFAVLGRSIAAAALAVSNGDFWLTSGYFDVEAIFKPLLHTWSLSVEWQFYAVWPLFLYIVWRLFRSTGAVAVAIAVAGLLSLAANLVFLDQPTTIFFLTPFRVYEFAIGAGVIWLDKWRPGSAWFAGLAAPVGLAIIVVSAVTFNSLTPHPGSQALVPCLGTALTIYGGQHAIGGRLLRWGPLVYLGKISYSFYLLHWPALVFYKYWRFEPVGGLELALLLLTSFVLATAMYHFIEMPFRRTRSRPVPLLAGFWKFSLVSLVGLFSLSAAGSAIWRFDGFDSESRTATLSSVYREAMSYPLCVDGLGVCQGEAAHVDYAIVGDSHTFVMQYLIGAIGVAQKASVSLYEPMPGCLAVYDNTDECQVQMNAALDRFIASGTKGLFLMSNWNPFTHRFSADFVLEHVGLSIRRLTAQGSAVYVNGVMPFMSVDPSTCLNRRINAGCPTVMVPPHFQEQRDFNIRLGQIVTAAGGRYLDMMADLCTDDGCAVAFHGASLYGDQYHFVARVIGGLLLAKRPGALAGGYNTLFTDGLKGDL